MSIFDKFKKNLSDVGNKRPGFMELVKNDTTMLNGDQNANYNRNGLIMTPTTQNVGNENAMVVRPSELDQSKGDLNNSSHYYRFKRHSLGY